MGLKHKRRVGGGAIDIYKKTCFEVCYKLQNIINKINKRGTYIKEDELVTGLK